MLGNEMLGDDAQRKAFFIREGANSIVQFEQELIRLAQTQPNTTFTSGDIFIKSFGCQFGGSGSQIMTIFYRQGNFAAFNPTVAEPLFERAYEASVTGAGSKDEPFEILWDGMPSFDLARRVLEEFTTFANLQE